MKKYVAKDEVVIDHYGEVPIERPNKYSFLKYDFDLRKNGDAYWRYLASADTIDEFNVHVNMAKSLAERGEYRILISNTLEIVRCSEWAL